jgi:hypothetical protein
MNSGEVIWISNCGMIWVVVDVDGKGDVRFSWSISFRR